MFETKYLSESTGNSYPSLDFSTLTNLICWWNCMLATFSLDFWCLTSMSWFSDREFQWIPIHVVDWMCTKFYEVSYLPVMTQNAHSVKLVRLEKYILLTLTICQACIAWNMVHYRLSTSYLILKLTVWYIHCFG